MRRRSWVVGQRASRSGAQAGTRACDGVAAVVRAEETVDHAPRAAPPRKKLLPAARRPSIPSPASRSWPNWPRDGPPSACWASGTNCRPPRPRLWPSPRPAPVGPTGPRAAISSRAAEANVATDRRPGPAARAFSRVGPLRPRAARMVRRLDVTDRAEKGAEKVESAIPFPRRNRPPRPGLADARAGEAAIASWRLCR